MRSTSPSNEPPAQRAWRSGWTVAIFLGIAILAAGSDLISKAAVFDWLLSRPQTVSKVQQIIDDPRVEVRSTPEFTRVVLQKAHISDRVSWGLSFTLSTNPGVVFGFDRLPRWIVNVFTAAAVVIILGLFAASPRGQTWLHVALALILGGAAGNLYDRLFSCVALPGLDTPICTHVRDFIDCSDVGYHWIFNLADAWLVVGVIMIAIHWIREGYAEAKAKKKKEHEEHR
jgi:lipoprotein signal peptidase